jgi:hypothetical protein
MTDTSISDAVVFPEDDGTGVPDGSEDYNSAGHFGLLSQHQGGTYVGNGLDFTNVDTTNDTVDITTGHAFVEFSSVTVQSGSGTTYDTTLPDAIVMTIVLPSNITLSLDTDATNDVYLATDPTTQDGAYLRHGSAVSEPTDPSVLLGTVNTADGSTTRASDNASPTFDTVTSNSVNTDDVTVTNGLVPGEKVGDATGTSESLTVSISNATDYRQLVIYVNQFRCDDRTFLLFDNDAGGNGNYGWLSNDGTISSAQDDLQLLNVSAASLLTGSITLNRNPENDQWSMGSNGLAASGTTISRLTDYTVRGQYENTITSSITLDSATIGGTGAVSMTVYGVK